MKKRLKWMLAFTAVYLLLVWLLYLAETSAPGHVIKNYGDALWYSLITLSTVGYGDMFPVSPAGKLIGAVFVLCSVGILASVIGICLRLVGGTLIPRLRLRLGRQHKWFAFAEENDDSAVLAAALRREDPDCLLIFPDHAAKTGCVPDAVRLGFDAELLLRLRAETDGLTLFLMGPDPWENYARALPAALRGVRTCCMGDIRVGRLPENLQLFSPTEAVSRTYWNRFPLKPEEKCIVLIGCGEAGCALLERALLNNVFITERGIEYHVFGDTQRFSDLHPETVRALDGTVPDADRLVLHRDPWTQERDLLLRADRVVFCMEDDRENLAGCDTLNSWYPVRAAVHVRLASPLPGIVCFGDRAETLTPENVLKEELNRRAVLMNDIYNSGSPHPTPWRELSPFHQQSNIAAADHLLVKARFLLEDDTLKELGPDVCSQAYARYLELSATQADLLQEMEHRRWMRFHQLYNWRYSPTRDNTLRLHPLMLPYHRLSREEQAKDAYAWEMFGRLSESTATGRKSS